MNALPPFSTVILACDAEAISNAAGLILRGLPVAVATETVYGLAGDATNGSAVAGIYQAKGRPGFNPLIIHASDLETAERIADFGNVARDLARRFWPGPLTLVLRSRPDSPIAPLATAGLPTVALRVPAHPAMQRLLAAVGRPLAAPSANRSGTISPTCAEHVRTSLDGRIPLILDSGPTRHGIESTIVGISGDVVRLLRPGPLGEAELGIPLAPSAGGLEAPGQMQVHYAPTKPLRLDATSAVDGEWLIGFGAIAGDSSLSASGNLIEAAALLFERLHEADAQHLPAIAVAPIPAIGIGVAINDRLSRAATPQETA